VQRPCSQSLQNCMEAIVAEQREQEGKVIEDEVREVV
jgi:hypothetical protein